MSGAGKSLRRRWDRRLLRMQGLLDGEQADRLLPWFGSFGVFLVLTALAAAAIRSGEPGSGLAPWLQAAWRRENGWAGSPVGGVDPARATWSLVSEPILWVTRFVPPEAVFTTVQAAAIGLAVIPLWRLAREDAQLRVGASVTVCLALVLAPALQRTNLTSFHPEVIALPALLWAYRAARQDHLYRYGALVGLVLICRADLGVTVAALGLVLASQGRRLQGMVTAVVGTGWSIAAVIALDPQLPDRALTPAGEFVARAVTPLAVLPSLFTDPIGAVRELLAEPSVLFLVVVLAPLLFLPLMAPRVLAVAVPGLMLAMIADQAVQREAQRGVLDLSPAAAHVAPALSFVFVATVYALERIGTRSVTRVNVDRRVLLALFAGASLFFVTEAPTSPYRQPWAWGSRDEVDRARHLAVTPIEPTDRVAASPRVTALVAERAHLVELPPGPEDLTDARVASVADRVDVVVLDTSEEAAPPNPNGWSDEQREEVLDRFAAQGFDEVFLSGGVYRLERSAG